MKENKRKPTIVRLAKESPASRKERASSGIKYRALPFASKKRRLLDKYYDEQDKRDDA